MSNSSSTGWCVLNANQAPRKTFCFSGGVITETTRAPWGRKESVIWRRNLGVRGTATPLANQGTVGTHFSRGQSPHLNYENNNRAGRNLSVVRTNETSSGRAPGGCTPSVSREERGEVGGLPAGATE